MDPDLADRLLAEDSGGELLGGTQALATVLFSDIRQFTSLAERLGAHSTVSLLNDYFERMVECIFDQGGMLDKFIGDAIMAVFGLPVPRDDDEDRALRAAISMIESLREWNVERSRRGDPVLDMGVGLNTDSVVAGNIGSGKRMDYTIIGDGVNLASRLEGACKHYGARILLSQSTKAKLRGVYRLREVDRIVVKGKSEPVAIFECFDYHDDESFPNLLEVRRGVQRRPGEVQSRRVRGWRSAGSSRRWRRIPTTRSPHCTSSAAERSSSLPRAPTGTAPG